MKTRFVQLYLLFVAIILTLTALAKLPDVFLFHLTSCMEGDPILGNLQPADISNHTLLGVAAGIELFIVGLICFSPWRWLPCLAAALWGTLCVAVRLFIIDPSVDCGCLGWPGQPSPSMNLMAGLLALAIAAGGLAALWMS